MKANPTLSITCSAGSLLSLGCLSLWLLLTPFPFAPASPFPSFPAAALYPELSGAVGYKIYTAPPGTSPVVRPASFPAQYLAEQGQASGTQCIFSLHPGFSPPELLLGWTHHHTHRCLKVWGCFDCQGDLGTPLSFGGRGQGH